MTEDKTPIPQATIRVYLDHSALNQIHKGRRPKIQEMLTRPEFQVVYSDVNLNEISKSVGFEQKFLSLLSVLNAKHLRLIMDDRFRYTEHASLETIEPAFAYEAYIANRNDSPSFDGGLKDLLKKFYGGHSNKSFGQILQSGGSELVHAIEAIAEELSSDVTIHRPISKHLRVCYLTSTPCGISHDEPWTKLQQVNAIYHQLNFLGCWRDENMNKRFDAHFNDLAHVGMASLCHLFITGDERQAMKAGATYEYLGISTIIGYLKPCATKM